MTAPTTDQPTPTQAQIDEVNERIDAVLARVTAMYVVRKAREQADLEHTAALAATEEMVA